MSALTAPAHLAATEFFIAQNPATVNMLRKTKVSDGRGGYTLSPGVAQAALTVRLVGSSLQGAARERTSVDGKAVFVEMALIAMPDSDIQAGDKFSALAHSWEILSVQTSPPWRLMAEVARHGS